MNNIAWMVLNFAFRVKGGFSTWDKRERVKITFLETSIVDFLI